jgi:imidazolonepropionase-like amidohydrolase
LTSPAGHCHFLGAEVTGDPREAVEEHVRRGVDVIKVMASGGFATPGSDQTGAQFNAPELRTMADAAHRAGLPLVAHAHSLIAALNALEAGADGIEHFSCLSPDGIEVDDDLLDDVARRGVAIGLTLGNDRSLHHLLPDPLPPPLAALMTRFGVATFDELYDTRIAFLSRLREHGVLVVAGVDSGMAPVKRHGNAWRTVCEQVEAGYPVAEALSSATSLAARACGLQNQTGRLATGLAADLLVATGDLTEDITALGAPAAVLLRGTPVHLAAA